MSSKYFSFDVGINSPFFCRALEVQAFLDTATETDFIGIKELLERGSSINSRGSMGSEHEWIEANRKNKMQQNLAAASMKFTYVVTCQIYGQQKKLKDYHAADILRLMKNYQGLRIAYVDEIQEEKGSRYYSVLVKYDHTLENEVEIYRIQLPGPLKLGEGKPENQNHALIFTRGDAVQTIDMNQVCYLSTSETAVLPSCTFICICILQLLVFICEIIS